MKEHCARWSKYREYLWRLGGGWYSAGRKIVLRCEIRCGRWYLTGWYSCDFFFFLINSSVLGKILEFSELIGIESSLIFTKWGHFWYSSFVSQALSKEKYKGTIFFFCHCFCAENWAKLILSIFVKSNGNINSLSLSENVFPQRKQFSYVKKLLEKAQLCSLYIFLYANSQVSKTTHRKVCFTDYSRSFQK